VKALIVWSATLFVVACSSLQVSSPVNDVGTTLPDTVSLRIGQTVRIASAEITFAGVPRDSRCPSDVVCVWAGNAVADVGVGPAFGKGPTIQLLLNTTVGERTGEAWGLRIELLDLLPVPVSTHSTRPEDYVLRLSVSAR
jgi:hypothetical protein